MLLLWFPPPKLSTVQICPPLVNTRPNFSPSLSIIPDKSGSTKVYVQSLSYLDAKFYKIETKTFKDLIIFVLEAQVKKKPNTTYL